MKEGWRPIYRRFTGPDGEEYEDYDGDEWDGVDDDEEENDDEETEDLEEYNELDSEYGEDDSTQYTTYEFDSPADFDQWCQDFGVDMHSVCVAVDLGPKFYNLLFYPKEAWIYLEDFNHDYGFKPEDIVYGYADEGVVPHKDWMAERFLERKREQLYQAIMMTNLKNIKKQQ